MFFSETIKTEDDINVHWIPINQNYVFMEISNVRCSPPQDQNRDKKDKRIRHNWPWDGLPLINMCFDADLKSEIQYDWTEFVHEWCLFIVGNPQLTKLWLLSTNHPSVNWQRNYSFVAEKKTNKKILIVTN
jgi:hypothetical protein